ncbi:alpha/beta hydrolase [Iningainema tapete]|uniref:Alpha/beta hydrolase n=1 Tax=Iningainema tapete BLCC-T55 TaxID=2748662 RepID=A0A8J6XU46_9CYAN|nr:alpha/beta hydrolase [Iningainema tapete]MBD2773968.1 alpha/beta hydrolase [Iningainema tapete BLCC-T55]
MKLGYLALLSGLVVSTASVNLYEAPVVTARIAAGMEMQTAQKSQVTTKRVEFSSFGTKVVGTLYLPSVSAGKKLPAVVVTGPQSSVKEQVAGRYARMLAEKGVIALAYDHRYFGESGGEPRQFEDPQRKVEDISSAVSFLSTLPQTNPNAIGALGICSGGGYTSKATAQDPRIKAMVTVAGFYHDPETFRTWLGDAAYTKRIEDATKSRQKYEKTGKVDYMVAVSETDSNVAMPGKEAFDYYGTKRGGVSGWANRFALMSFEPFFQFNAIDAGKEIQVPSLVIHSDKALTPDSAKRFYQSIPAKDKSIHWMVTSNHIDFYDQSRYVEEATDKAAGWFLSKL